MPGNPIHQPVTPCNYRAQLKRCYNIRDHDFLLQGIECLSTIVQIEQGCFSLLAMLLHNLPTFALTEGFITDQVSYHQILQRFIHALNL